MSFFDAQPCGPFDCDPAYNNQADMIRNYLRERTHVLVLDAQPIFAAFNIDPDPIGPSFKTHMITRYKASGPAPWTEKPFVYWWYVGVDEQGRQIGDGEPARIHYLTSTEAAANCTCPDDDGWKCIRGYVYGPCGAANCYGVCSLEGYCTCPLHTWSNGIGRSDDLTHEAPSMMALDAIEANA